MVQRILVPIDGSEMAEHALEHALETHPDAAITVLHIVGIPSPMMGGAVELALESDLEEAAADDADEVLAGAREIGRAYGVTLETDVAWGNPAKAIVDRAGEFDTVVIGSHSGSLADRLFVGNVAQKVVRHSPVPVTVVR